MISKGDMPAEAYAVGAGMVAAQVREGELLLMDDDRIMRTLNVDGVIRRITQTPRKRRLIVERHAAEGEPPELAWLKGREIRGFITNPYDDALPAMNATFVSDTFFSYFVERPDGLFSLREGYFSGPRQIRSRLVGAPLSGVGGESMSCDDGRALFFFTEEPSGGFQPLCRRLADGRDWLIGDPLNASPRAMSTARNAGYMSWIDGEGGIYVAGLEYQPKRIGETGARLLTMSHDGQQLAWWHDELLSIYDVHQDQIEQWPAPGELLALGWRSEG